MASRLLLVGLPLTILLGFGFGVLLFDELSWFTLALLATMLAPTDAALGKAVVTNEAVPNEVRQGLNVESGLNDGICVPIFFVFLALATGEAAEKSPSYLALALVAEEIGIGLAVGLGLTAVAGWLLRYAWVRIDMGVTAESLHYKRVAVSAWAAVIFGGGCAGNLSRRRSSRKLGSGSGSV